MADIIDLYLGGVIDSYIENDCIKDPRYDIPFYFVLVDLRDHGLTFKPGDHTMDELNELNKQLYKVMKFFYKFDTIIWQGEGWEAEPHIKWFIIKKGKKVVETLYDLDSGVTYYSDEYEDDFDYCEDFIERALYRDKLLMESNGLPVMGDFENGAPVMTPDKEGPYKLLYFLEDESDLEA